MSSAVPAESGLPGVVHKQFLGHPRPLYTLFFTEMWERFSYYGMRALLMFFMLLPVARGGLGLPTARAAIIYGIYTASVYMVAIPGGSLADNLLGSRLAVLVGGIIIAAGHFSMAFPSEQTFYLGLGLVVIGTSLLKPNISAMVGMLYAPGDSRRDAGFSIFYMGINIGATVSPFVTGFLAQHSWFQAKLSAWGFNPDHSWHWGFAAAGVGMVFGVVGFVIYGGNLKQVAPPPVRVPGFWKKPLFALVGTLALLGLLVASDFTPGLSKLQFIFVVVPAVGMAWFGASRNPDTRRLAAVCYFVIGAIVFWALYEQAGSSLNLFADQFTVTHIAGFEVPSSWYQSVPAIFVILLAFLFAVLWTKLGDRQPSSPMKFTIALFFLAASFALMIPASRLAVSGRVSPLWLIGVYFLQTVGEMFLSPVGLSVFTKLAPVRLVGLMLGVWLLAMGLGNKFAGVLASSFGEGDASHLDQFFGQQALAVFVISGLFLVLVPWVRRRMGGVL
jgi:POT family proton-dependent oligopeptide transporter